MKAGSFGILLFVTSIGITPVGGRAASIVWGTHEDAGARYGSRQRSTPLPGIRVPGGTPNLSNGALVQLYKAVGAIDEPQGVMEAYQSTYWIVDDILLDVVHVGYGLGPPGAPADGEWSRTATVDIAPDDVLYARIYNLPLADWEAGAISDRRVGIRNMNDMVISHTVEQVVNPETYYFDNMLLWIPEPTPFAFLVPGFAFWALKRRRRFSR